MQRVRLDYMISSSVNVVSEVPQGSVLEPLFYILYTSELFRIIRNHIVGNVDDTTIYAVIHRPISRPKVRVYLNQDFSAVTPGV